MALTEEELAIVTSLFTQGRAYLHENGVSAESLRNILSREDVLSYLQALSNEAVEQPGMMERVQFLANRRLRRMVPKALDVYEAALDGTTYLKDEKGQYVVDKTGKRFVVKYGPGPQQVMVAQDVLNRTNVLPGQEYAPVTSAGVKRLVDEARTPPEIVYRSGLSNPERLLSRERVRSVLDRISLQFPALREQAEKKLLRGPRPLSKAYEEEEEKSTPQEAVATRQNESTAQAEAARGRASASNLVSRGRRRKSRKDSAADGQ